MSSNNADRGEASQAVVFPVYKLLFVNTECIVPRRSYNLLRAVNSDKDCTNLVDFNKVTIAHTTLCEISKSSPYGFLAEWETLSAVSSCFFTNVVRSIGVLGSKVFTPTVSIPALSSLISPKLLFSHHLELYISHVLSTVSQPNFTKSLPFSSNITSLGRQALLSLSGTTNLVSWPPLVPPLTSFRASYPACHIHTCSLSFTSPTCCS